MRARRFFWIVLILCSVLFAACSSAKFAYNKMYPQDRAYAPGELATLCVVYPLKIDSLDGIKVEKVGGKHTVIELLPGDHEVEHHIFEAESRFDANLKRQSGESVMESGKKTVTINTQPGWFHILRIYAINKYQSSFMRVFERGPNPFRTPQGYLITFDLREQMIIVEKGQERRSYPLDPRYVFYSLDNHHLAFITELKGKKIAVRDGIEGEPFNADYKAQAAWSIDGQHFAYAGVIGRHQCVVVDNQQRGPYKDMLYTSCPFFFDLEGRLIYGIQTQDGWYMMRGEGAIKMHDDAAVREAINNELIECAKKAPRLRMLYLTSH